MSAAAASSADGGLIQNPAILDQLQRDAARQAALPDCVLQFRLEQTRESLAVALRLMAAGRIELATTFIRGAADLMDRDMGVTR
jgi:hypothetical protein